MVNILKKLILGTKIKINFILLVGILLLILAYLLIPTFTAKPKIISRRSSVVYNIEYTMEGTESVKYTVTWDPYFRRDDNITIYWHSALLMHTDAYNKKTSKPLETIKGKRYHVSFIIPLKDADNYEIGIRGVEMVPLGEGHSFKKLTLPYPVVTKKETATISPALQSD